MKLNLLEIKLLIIQLESILGKNINWINKNDYKLKKSIRQKYVVSPYIDTNLFNPQLLLLQQPIIPQPYITMNPIINSLDKNNVSISKEMLNKIILYINNLKKKKCPECSTCNNCPKGKECPTCPECPKGKECPTCPECPKGKECPTCPDCIDLSRFAKLLILLKKKLVAINKHTKN